MPGRPPQERRPVLARRSFDSSGVLGQRVSVDAGIRRDSRAGRCVPTDRLREAHCHRYEGMDGCAVRARGHAAWIVRPLAPKRGHSRRFANLSAFSTALRRQPIAHAIGCICGRRIEQEHCRDGQCLEEGSHGGEIKVYRPGGCPQGVLHGERRRGVKPGGAGCRISGRGQSTIRRPVSPPSRLKGEHGVPRVYSSTDAGSGTESGNPAIAALRRCRSPSNAGSCSVARPT